MALYVTFYESGPDALELILVPRARVDEFPFVTSGLVGRWYLREWNEVLSDL